LAIACWFDDLNLLNLEAFLDSEIRNMLLCLYLTIKKKMGWKENTALGKRATGIIEPIRIEVKSETLGLGKKEEIEEYTQSIKRYLSIECTYEFKFLVLFLISNSWISFFGQFTVRYLPLR
jgi:hypothetical protein